MKPVRVAAPSGPLAGEVAVPGDKSVAHRALLLGGLAEGTTVVRGFSGGADVTATLEGVRRLGAAVRREGDVVSVEGRGLELGAGASVDLDCANSGTTMRLGAGLVAGRPGRISLDGDASLRRRPMERVAEPLRRMGAAVETTDGHAPLRIRGGELRGIDFALPVASAQLKSAVLLAGLRARGTTRVREPLPTRDHTERMLTYMGVRLERRADAVALAGGQQLAAREILLPGDASSAAFLMVAALLVPGSEVRLANVGMNPARTGSLAVLRRMGGRIETLRTWEEAGEPRADLLVRASALHGTVIAPEEVPAAIDELPVLAVAAAFAAGETRVSGAAELRVKESDRLAALEQLRPLGVEIETQPDGLVVHGRPERPLAAGRIDPRGDHRIAMAFAIAALRAPDGITIDDPACVDVSFPGFFARLRALGGVAEEGA